MFVRTYTAMLSIWSSQSSHQPLSTVANFCQISEGVAVVDIKILGLQGQGLQGVGFQGLSG